MQIHHEVQTIYKNISAQKIPRWKEYQIPRYGNDVREEEKKNETKWKDLILNL